MARTTPATPGLEAVEVAGMSRGAFLVRGALATGTLLGASAVGPFVGRALAQETGSDADILNFALTLEYLEMAFYTRAVAKGRGMSGETMRLARELRDNETAHVDALTQTLRGLGAQPVDSPTVGFGDVFTSEGAFLKMAQTLEDTGVSAYNGAAPHIRSGDVLAAAGSIVQVEARHAALIRLARGEDPAPDAFDPSLEKAQVLAAVKPFVMG
jgi:rubrerythrin